MFISKLATEGLTNVDNNMYHLLDLSIGKVGQYKMGHLSHQALQWHQWLWSRSSKTSLPQYDHMTGSIWIQCKIINHHTRTWLLLYIQISRTMFTARLKVICWLVLFSLGFLYEVYILNKVFSSVTIDNG